MSWHSPLSRGVLTLAIAAPAGLLLDAAGLPLGWLIGPMLVMIAASVLDLPAQQPTAAVPWVKSSVGTLLGAAITWPVLQALTAWWPTLLSMFALLALAMTLNYRLLRRGFGFAPVDAALCAAPGGIAEMIILGETAGADPRRVAIVHALRIALSILLVPVLMALFFDVGATQASVAPAAAISLPDWGWFGLCALSGVAADRWSRIPLPFVTVPALLCAVLHLTGVTQFAVPGIVSATMQLVIGMNVGARFQNATLRQLAPVFGAAVSVIAVQITLALAGAWLVARMTGFDPLTLMLAYAPGGLAEMSLIAIAVGRDVAFVGLHHLFRVLAALLVAPTLIHRLTRNLP